MTTENQKIKKINDETVKKIVGRKGKRPNLAILLIGDDQVSHKFVKKLEDEAKKIGIDTHCYKCSEKDNQSDIISTIEFLNSDDVINAVFLKLPIPKNFDSEKIMACLSPNKKIVQTFSNEGEDMDIALLFQDILKLSE